MNKHREQREELVKKLSAHVLAEGLGAASLRRMAAAAGTSDRMLLYYFRDKADLLEAVLSAGAGSLGESLDAALPGPGPFAPTELFARLGELAASPQMRPFMRLWSEMSAAAGRGEQPISDIAERIAAGFAAWGEARLAVEDPEERAELAALLLVLIDGGALLEPLAGGNHTRRAQAAIAKLLATRDLVAR